LSAAIFIRRPSGGFILRLYGGLEGLSAVFMTGCVRKNQLL